jgi:hypothetical protein
MKPTLTFEGRDPGDAEPLFIDGKPMDVAVATEIKDGPLAGIHIFSNRARAEEWCWKNGFEPAFEGESA